MGGRAAEEILFHEVTGGAANDFEAANRIATAMVTRWGMGHDPEGTDRGVSGRGALSFFVPTGGARLLPSEVQAAATRATRAILDEAYAEASRTLVEHMETLRRLAAWLVEHERVDGPTFDDLFEGRLAVPNADDEWRAATARPRAWGDVVDLAGRRTVRPALPLAAAATAPTPTGEAGGDPLPALAASAATGAILPADVPDRAAAALTATIAATPVDIGTIDPSMAASLDSTMAPSHLAAASASVRSRIRRRRGGPTPSRRGSLTRLLRDTLADGLAVAEGRLRSRRSNEDRT
jgi:cell division protease FtsH